MLGVELTQVRGRCCERDNNTHFDYIFLLSSLPCFVAETEAIAHMNFYNVSFFYFYHSYLKLLLVKVYHSLYR